MLTLSEQIFQSLQNLNDVYFDYNFLRELPANLFINNTKLTIIEMNYNSVKYLSEDVFKPLPELKILTLPGNRIESINSTRVFENNRKLTTLHIAYNMLTSLNSVLFSNNYNMEIWLEGNPWHCDCHVTAQQEIFKLHNIRIGVDPRCESPPELQSSHWTSLGPLLCDP